MNEMRDIRNTVILITPIPTFLQIEDSPFRHQEDASNTTWQTVHEMSCTQLV